MKSRIVLLALATGLSTAAHAGPTLLGEVRIGGVANDQRNSTEYKVEYADTYKGLVYYAAELQTKQAENAGSLGSKVSLKLGPTLPVVAGIKPTAYAEVGKNLKQGNNFEFWGAGIKASRALYGPVSLSAGYRHREGFEAGDIKEDRLNAGLSYAVNDSTAVGATYYRTTGTTRDDAIGLSITKKF